MLDEFQRRGMDMTKLMKNMYDQSVWMAGSWVLAALYGFCCKWEPGDVDLWVRDSQAVALPEHVTFHPTKLATEIGLEVKQK